jgi:TolA-binding protein
MQEAYFREGEALMGLCRFADAAGALFESTERGGGANKEAEALFKKCVRLGREQSAAAANKK